MLAASIESSVVWQAVFKESTFHFSKLIIIIAVAEAHIVLVARSIKAEGKGGDWPAFLGALHCSLPIESRNVLRYRRVLLVPSPCTCKLGALTLAVIIFIAWILQTVHFCELSGPLLFVTCVCEHFLAILHLHFVGFKFLWNC